jgi:hypothetical protein
MRRSIGDLAFIYAKASEQVSIMPLHRALALAAVFTVGMTPLASACCNWDHWGYFGPDVTNQAAIAPASIYVGPWSGSWLGENSVWARGPRGVPPPFFVVNQGPEYSGPGLTVPFVTYSPAMGLAVPRKYPYVR